MRKLMDKIKKNNKGFTLVELIVVIAIIAIISIAVAPQYIKYVEKSKEATDKNAMAEIAHAAEIAYVEASTTETLATATVSVAANGTLTISDGLDTALEEIIPQGDDQYVFTSKLYTTNMPITITIDTTTGMASWTEPTEVKK